MKPTQDVRSVSSSNNISPCPYLSHTSVCTPQLCSSDNSRQGVTACLPLTQAKPPLVACSPIISQDELRKLCSVQPHAEIRRPTLSRRPSSGGGQFASFGKRLMNVIARKCSPRFKREHKANADNSSGEDSRLSKPFVNIGLDRWNKARQEWLTQPSSYTPKPKYPTSADQRATDVEHVYQSLVSAESSIFPRKIPLAEFVDLLQDVREMTGWFFFFLPFVVFPLFVCYYGRSFGLLA